MGNEVKIRLTDAQKAKIKEATGKDLPEIRLETFGTPAAPSVSKAISARAAGKAVSARAAGKAGL